MKKRTTKQSSKARVTSAPRPRVYLDSTIPSVFCDERDSIRFETEITRRWWREESENYEVWISPATLAELEDGNHPHKAKILEFADALNLLPPDPAVDALAQTYIQHQVMPRKHLGDAWHLAYATFHGFDFLLTWNCNHLANANKRRHLETVNWRIGFETPEIVTPLELFREREDL
jgi:hypothetical protein